MKDYINYILKRVLETLALLVIASGVSLAILFMIANIKIVLITTGITFLIATIGYTFRKIVNKLDKKSG